MFVANVNMRRLLFFVAVLSLPLVGTYAQGCSDAGFCSMGALQSAGPVFYDTAVRYSTIGLTFVAGSGEQGTSIYNIQADLRLCTSDVGYLELKVPYVTTSGNLGSYSGLGDIMLTQTIVGRYKDYGWNPSFTGGFRASTGNANASYNGRPLPMPYQANLGTLDIILGLSVDRSFGKFGVVGAIGVQNPVAQYNQNQYYDTIPYNADVDTSYFNSRNLIRKGDALLRLEGNYKTRFFTLAAGPLFIYHVTEDHVSTPNENDLALKGSKGLTLNIAGSITVPLDRLTLKLTGGSPVVVRDYRPDGLTRSWVATFGAAWSF